ncbi:MAG: transcriptional regulator [Chloroflexi bacterium]|nr:transcriptional regulator [Chloroflexota bacterium]
MARKKIKASRKWYSMDLHLHTPASSDYKTSGVTYLDILLKADNLSLDMIAFTDHNTVAGYSHMHEEIERLRLLAKLERILPEEQARLIEYERLLKRILVFPGFEFTATLGFHILAIFPPNKPVREVEHLLLDMNIPADQLDRGSVTVGASADVLTAYRLVNEAGGLAIAAHANSTNGIAMRGLTFGGQTKIAYTQDPNLHALEVTDLEQRGRRTTAAFFSGAKPEYPRRMHCIQGSDAHRLENDSQSKKNFGVGGRITEVLLPEPAFEALKELFERNDFARTRPRRKKKGESAYDFVRGAREEGSNIIQDFHEAMTVSGGKLYGVIADVCGFANTNGGTLYIGLSNDPKTQIAGINNPPQAIRQLEKEISNRISPPLQCTVDGHKSGGKNILRVLIPRGDDPPYAVDDNKIYIRQEADTGLAVRDEIVGLVQRGKPSRASAVAPGSKQQTGVTSGHEQPVKTKGKKDKEQAPRTGVEIVSVEERKGTRYYIVKDLRNGNVVKNVTEKSARRLWHYAITTYAKMPKDSKKTQAEWAGNLGFIKRYQQGKSMRYDLVQRNGKNFRYYFGVTDDGIHGGWRKVVGAEE